MPKGPGGEKRPADVVGYTVAVAKIATGEIEKNLTKPPDRVKIRKAGGVARANVLSPKRRREIAKKAAAARGY